MTRDTRGVYLPAVSRAAAAVAQLRALDRGNPEIASALEWAR